MGEFECVYIGKSNEQVQLLGLRLRAEGIDAQVVEDQQPYGVYLLGTNTGIAQPKIFVRKTDFSRAYSYLEKLEQSNGSAVKEQGAAFCYHCGAACSEHDPACPTCRGALTSERDSQVVSESGQDGTSLDALAAPGRSIAYAWAYTIIVLLVCVSSLLAFTIVRSVFRGLF